MREQTFSHLESYNSRQHRQKLANRSFCKDHSNGIRLSIDIIGISSKNICIY